MPKPRQSGSVYWNERGAAHFCGGEGAPLVPMSMHKENRQKLCEHLRKRSEVAGGDAAAGAVVFLEGGSERSMYDTDVEWDLFRQESNFQYLFGVKEPGCLAFLRVSDAKAVLLIPRLEPVYETWMGPIKPPAWFHSAYEVDEVGFVDEAKDVLQSLKPSRLICYRGVNRDSGLTLPEPKFDGLDSSMIDDAASKVLWDEIGECRNIKSAEEIKVLQYVNDISSEAHLAVMRKIKAGQREHLSEAEFRYQSSLRACHRVGYNCICPTGPRNAILHYGHPAERNAEPVDADALTLHDMGCEYHCYTADVTVTFPVNGKFTDAQRIIYEAVWAATLAVEQHVRPGVSYKDMHRLAQRTLCQELKAAGLFKGDVEDMMKADLIGRFMPHGLGHNLGLDVHDVAGFPPGVGKKDDPSIKQNLRLGRDLMENMVITVEPGFYFVDYLLKELKDTPEQMKFVDEARLEELRHVGGVRIEDDVVITATGCRVLTKVPRTVAEIEAFMAGTPWPISQAREYTALDFVPPSRV
eukprot:TRINITY_DN123616_c0_g1_i1.p1 TRINITY_DN123616_c0_g1~~TRINITY_DN123616_c0_g1_i1.p1  ORF type:complete len:524 (+),score=120.98 TRINITY_DN123616_c0_g1_i1:102-1673(+)